MGRQKIGKESVRTITQNNSGTYSVTLPKELMRELRWQKRQRVTVKRKGKQLLITDYK